MTPLFETTVPPFVFRQGTAPLLISMPYGGVHVPSAGAQPLTAEGRDVHDTDWHLPFDYSPEVAAGVQPVLRALLGACLAIATGH